MMVLFSSLFPLFFCLLVLCHFRARNLGPFEHGTFGAASARLGLVTTPTVVKFGGNPPGAYEVPVTAKVPEAL